MNSIMALGLMAGALTTFSFLPQVIKTLRLKETKDLSLWMYVLFCTGIFTWLIYGIIIKDIPVMIANAVSLILASIILFAKLRYR
ncbi:MAG TPA: SemiSWEET transporter [Candidatus Nanoarchaeia archaeon]|nr:SemiSWEET transporter [Candidatus Nanoarchaeia archaeon]